MGGAGERIRVGTVLAAVGLVVVLGACRPLREYPAAQTLFLGSAARASLLTDPAYTENLAREFNGLVPENELKWDTIHPAQTTYNFGPADALVNFARAHNMKVRGVPLVWHEQNPAWLGSGNFNGTQMRYIMANHIATVVGHYRGRIVQWDVVNEPFELDGTLRNTVFRRIGLRYMDDAFAMAHAADPAAKLFLNERGIEVPGTKANAVFDAVSKMRARGVPIHGVGIQMHASTTLPTAPQLAAQIARYASIGVEVAITEIDVALAVPPSVTALEAQARTYRFALAACQAAPNCHTFVTWGFTDRYSWIPQFFPGMGAATIMDASYGKKLAYAALNQQLGQG